MKAQGNNMAGHFPGRVPNQASLQLSALSQQNGNFLPAQMRNLGAHNVDRDPAIVRHFMREQITQILQRKSGKPSAEWLQKLPEFARRLEEILFRDAASKEESEDYMNMAVETIEHRVDAILRMMTSKNRPSSHHLSSSSSISTMIPTPGMPHSGGTRSIVSCPVDNSMMTTSGADMVAQTRANMGNLLPISNGSVGIGHNSSFNASDGSIVNRYQQSPSNAALGSGGNSIMPSMSISQPLSQMIPTPGLNNLQPLPINSECSNGVGVSSIDSTMVSQKQQQKQHVGSQNNRILHTLGSQMGVGPISNFQKMPPTYGFSNGVMNGGFGLFGSNTQLVNGPAASEGYLSATSYGSSPKPLQQQFHQQHHQPMSTSMSQQLLPMSHDGYAMNSAELSGSENLYGSASSVASSFNNQSMNPISLHSEPETNNALLPCITSLQPTQHLLQSRHHIQNFQQRPNQPYPQLVQHQHQQQQQQQQQSQQQQQLILEKNTLRQFSMTSNFGGQQMTEHGTEPHNESCPQAVEQFHLSELQSQCHQNTSTGNHPKVAQFLSHLSDPQDFQPSSSQGSQQMLQMQRQTTETQNGYNGLFGGSQPDALQQGHWHPQPLQKSQLSDKLVFEQMEEFQKRLTGQEKAQQPRFEACVTGHAAVTRSISVPQSLSRVACMPGNSKHEQDYPKQQKWLSFLIHARRCPAPKGACEEVNCIKAQQLWVHMESCNLNQCEFPRCPPSKKLLEHFHNCSTADCPVCSRVRDLVTSNRKAHRCLLSDTGLSNQKSDPWRTVNTRGVDNMETMTDPLLSETTEDPRPLLDNMETMTGPLLTETSEDLRPLKRMKVQPTCSSLVPKKKSSPVSATGISQPHVPEEAQSTAMSTMSEVPDAKINSSLGFGQVIPSTFGNIVGGNVDTARRTVAPLVTNDVVRHAKQETMLNEKESDQVKMEFKQEANAPISDPVAGSKSGKPKVKGVSLTELFTPDQIREHIVSLRRWVGQSKAKAEKNQAMEHSMNENSCQLCAVENLNFEPPPIYCTPCGARIKRNATYYTMGTGDTRYYFCIPCYNEARGDTINVGGSPFLKAKLEKKKNDEETNEWWVLCDKCQAWQHQICALFNGRRNNVDETEYTCPNCYMKEIETGERKPLAQSAVLGAKDLPTTVLSDHIEQRLFRRLKQERQERARHLGKKIDEVPGAESLVVRVVSSVDKKLEVKQHFLEIFQEENYPTSFPYKSKVILLFQKIEGVEVCLFGMYVQEFGSECQFPNQRRIYLSYLDSVKYFRPEIRTVTGEALRTFVYHEILIGYLEYCKKRGFSSCYIWACPPVKGEDYILYCHPEIQKTPKSDKLREWYLSMLRKAAKESIVVELTNLYDQFFATLGECKAKVTAARLPYFDGDYWSGAAEDMINQLRQEEDGRKQQKKGKTKKALTKRALKAAGQTDLSVNASLDALLMQKLGQTISPMKEDFIMVHLQHACTHCCLLMVSGTRWVCNKCKNFQLCDKCHVAEQRLQERDRHPINSREKHVLCPVEINDVPSDTKDKDEILESEFFDTRQAFLSLCQGNHYQYDTLRRAKHSSMMILYHLHNPTAPAFVTSCNVCHHDIETGQGWRCEICPDFDVCNACYQNGSCVDHPHKLTNHPSLAVRDAQNQEARQKRVLQVREMLDLLVHASRCLTARCHYPNCRKVKGLFRHGIGCKIRSSGGCLYCQKIWELLQRHARACKDSDCRVPRCKELKEHMRRVQQQSDSRRRAAMDEMVRQRAADVAAER